MTTALILPDVEKVSVAWLNRLTSVFGTGIVAGAATTLPQTDPNGMWNNLPVFLLANGGPGIANRIYALRANTVRVDAFAPRGMLGQVSSIGELVQEATYTGEGCGVLSLGAKLATVDLRDVSVFSTPRQVRGDAEAMARVTMVLILTYTIIPQGG